MRFLAKIVPSLALALALAMPATLVEARQKASSPQIQAAIDRVLFRAKPSVGKPMARGMILRRAHQLGDIIMFDIDIVDKQMAATARTNPQILQNFVGKNMGRKFCRKGSGTRSFVDMGGEIQILFKEGRKVLSGGRLTRC